MSQFVSIVGVCFQLNVTQSKLSTNDTHVLLKCLRAGLTSGWSMEGNKIDKKIDFLQAKLGWKSILVCKTGKIAAESLYSDTCLQNNKKIGKCYPTYQHCMCKLFK